jgi:hypothetical protein
VTGREDPHRDQSDDLEPVPTAVDSPPLTAENRRALYERLRRAGVDLDALHDVFERTGGSILDRSVPYALVATRNRLRDVGRSDSRRRDREGSYEAALQAPGVEALDPAERLDAREDLRRAIRALAQLEERDAWLLWWHAGGFSDAEVVDLWTDAAFEPHRPSAAYLAVRRHRARSRLREIFDDDDSAPSESP